MPLHSPEGQDNPDFPKTCDKRFLGSGKSLHENQPNGVDAKPISAKLCVSQKSFVYAAVAELADALG
ncbi:hypothetical protein OAA19_00770 [Rubripirellula sp.]|nr:hypothetical protein [Rubripirellula sp.]MDB4338620.1 hypothetical protein [Rubripirellula sp.]